MQTEYNAKYRTRGYGNTKEEALEELEFNTLRDDINRDESKIWLNKILNNHSWIPVPGLIHFDNICSVRRQNEILLNMKTNKVTIFDDTPLCQYISLFSCLSGDIDFKTFNLVYSQVIDEFFKETNAGQLKDFPITKPATLSFVRCMHRIGEQGFVAETSMDNIIIVSDWKTMYEIEVPYKVPVENIIAYGFAKLGFLYDGVRLTKISSK